MSDADIRHLEAGYRNGHDYGLRLLNVYKRVQHQNYLPFRAEMGYVAETADMSLPTAEQTRAFVDYVSGAHSWYKHLPRDAPGVPFVYYLDPHAGMCSHRSGERVPGNWGEVVEDDLFHYSDRTTKVWRESFGNWSYSVMDLPGQADISIESEALTRVVVPTGLVQVGTALVTSAVYQGFRCTGQGLEECERMLAAALAFVDELRRLRREAGFTPEPR